MSIHNANRQWRRVRRVAAIVPVMMAAAVPTVSARSPVHHASVYAGSAKASTRAQGASLPAEGRVLIGLTSQGWPVGAEISDARSKLMLVETGLEVRCTSGVRYQVAAFWGQLAISPSGRVHAREAIPLSAGANVVLTGGSDSFSGRINHRRSTLRGVWHVHLTFIRASGQMDQCDSGRVTFTATV
jgi:hypothetical protein